MVQPMGVLADVHDRHRAAAGVDITHHVIAWPVMADTVRILRRLRLVTADGVSRALEELVERAASWLRILSAAPLDPAHPLVATDALAAAVRAHDTGGLDPRLRPELGRLAGLFDALAADPHPAARCLEEVVCRYGRNAASDPPELYVAAEAHEAHLVEVWLAAEELDAEVRAPAALRKAPVRDALVLLGPPTHYFTSAWCGPARAARIGGWLLSAPPARRVHVLTWPGHARLDAAGANAFPATAPLPVRVVVPTPPSATGSETDGSGAGGHGGAPAGAGDDDDAVWLPPAPVAAHIAVVRAWAGDRDPVPALGMRLAGDRIVFYSPGLKPVPEAVTWDFDAVAVDDVAAAAVRVGTVLLFRPVRSATDGELYRRADALLAARYGPTAPAAAQAAKAELKDALATAEGAGRPQHPWLAAKLGDAAYARHILARLPEPGYIAPEKPGAYQALRGVLGLAPDTDGSREALVVALRGACRRAGIEITRELIDVLRTTTGWQAEVEADGCAVINGGPLLGCLDIRAVTAVDASPRRVGRSRLGRLMRSAERPQHTVAPIDLEETT